MSSIVNTDQFGYQDPFTVPENTIRLDVVAPQPITGYDLHTIGQTIRSISGITEQVDSIAQLLPTAKIRYVFCRDDEYIHSSDMYLVLYLSYFRLASKLGSQKIWLSKEIESAYTADLNHASDTPQIYSSSEYDIQRARVLSDIFTLLTGRDPLEEELIHPSSGARRIVEYWYKEVPEIHMFIEYRCLIFTLIEFFKEKNYSFEKYEKDKH